MLAHSALAGGGSRPKDGSREWDPNRSNDCSYACKEIPPDRVVLKEFRPGTQDTLDSSRFRVVAWNLYKGRMKNFRNEFLTFTKGADLILTSEVIDTDPIKPTFLAIQEMGWAFATTFLMKDNVATGVAIGAKARAEEVRFSRTDDLEPFVKSPKTTIMATYGIPGSSERLLALSIHGINWDGDDAIVRQLEKVVPAIQAHQGPVVFAGDFNTKNDNRVELSKQTLARAGLRYVPLENAPTEKKLDIAFVRELTVHRAKLVYDYVDTASDHPAIDLDLSYEGK